MNKKKVKDAANEGGDRFRDQQSYVRSLVNVLDDNQWTVPDNVKVNYDIYSFDIFIVDFSIGFVFMVFLNLSWFLRF